MRYNKNRPERFSDAQKLLGSSLKLLIKLYYSNDYSRPQKKWSWEQIRQIIESLLIQLYGTECEYRFDKDEHKFNISGRNMSRNFRVNDSQLRRFKSMMDNLYEAIAKQSLFNLELAGLADEVITDLKKAKNENDIEINFSNGKSIKKSSSPQKNVMRQGISVINKAIIETIPNEYEDEYNEGNSYYVNVKHSRKYRVRPITEFGNYLLSENEELGDTKRFEHFTSSNIKSFSRLSRNILIHLHLVFDGFSRVKICKYDECKKLFFEKYKGRGVFCSGTCRKKYNDLSWPKDRRECRNRQNQWVKKEVRKREKETKQKAQNIYTIYKSICLECDGAKETGSCIKLCKDNKLPIQN